MQGATQYWKPGEAKPQKTDGEELEKRDHKKKKRRRKDAQTDDRQSGGGGGGARSGGKARRYTDSQTPEQQGKYKGKDNIESKPSSGSKVASGPSQTLLAMKVFSLNTSRLYPLHVCICAYRDCGAYLWQ